MHATRTLGPRCSCMHNNLPSSRNFPSKSRSEARTSGHKARIDGKSRNYSADGRSHLVCYSTRNNHEISLTRTKQSGRELSHSRCSRNHT